MILVLGFAFVAGVLTILAPCTLPVVPLVLGGAAGGGRRRVAGILLGFGATFVVLTVLVAAVLAALGVTTSLLRLGAVAVLGLVGATLVFPRLGRVLARAIPGKSRGTTLGPRGGGFGGGLLIGSAIGLVWAPCVGPIMAAVIATAVASGPSIEALAIASAYVLGAAIPLAIIARLGRRATRRVDRRGAERLRRGFGVAMVAAAVVVVTGLDVPLQARLTEALPAGWTDALLAVEGRLEPDASPAAPGTPDAVAAAPLPDLGPAPELTGITARINSAPTTIEARTFGCINCIRVQPYVKAWYDTYESQGFVVLGVHSPEFSHERDVDNVRATVEKAGVRFPVATDPAFATWKAFENRFWPAFHFIDRQGHIRSISAGEGDYEGKEAVIRELLAERP